MCQPRIQFAPSASTSLSCQSWMLALSRTMLVHSILRMQPCCRSRSPGIDAERRRRLERRSRSRERSGELPPPPRGVQVLLIPDCRSAHDTTHATHTFTVLLLAANRSAQHYTLQRHRAPDDERPLAPPPARGGTLPGFVSAADRASIPAASQPVEGESEADRKSRAKREKKVTWI
jgi:hypothetical protein